VFDASKPPAGENDAVYPDNFRLPHKAARSGLERISRAVWPTVGREVGRAWLRLSPGVRASKKPCIEP